MKSPRKTLYRMFAQYGMTLIAVGAVSCESHDSFCFDHHHGVVSVQYDWTKAPDASGIGSTRVNFYRSADGSLAATANFSGMTGGNVHLNAGTYDVIAYNSDTDQVHWRGDGHISTLEAYTRDATLTEDLPGYTYWPIDGLVLYPNRIWRARHDKVTITDIDTTLVTLVPTKATYEVIWSVSGVRQASRANAFAISLSGIGGSLMLGDLNTERNSSLMASAGVLSNIDDDGSGTFTGAIEFFGCQQADICHHTLTLYCWANGGNIRATYPLESQLHFVADDRKIYINIEVDIEVPAGGGGGSGFTPDVDSWGSVNEDILL